MAVTGKKLSSSEVLERAAKRKRVGGSKAESPAAAPIPKPPVKKKDGEVVKAKGRYVSLPEDFLAGEGVDQEVWPAAESLIFPAALHRLQTLPVGKVAEHGIGHTLQALQHFFALKLHSDSALEELTKKVESQALEIKDLKEKLGESEERRISEAKAAAERLEGKQEEMGGQIEALKEEMLDSEAVGEVRGRARLGWEIYSSKGDIGAVKRIAQNAVDFYLENVGNMSDLKSVDEEAQATTSTADSGLGGEKTAGVMTSPNSPAPSA